MLAGALGAVLYAVDVERVARFYEGVCGLTVTANGDGFIQLASASSSVEIVRVPDAIAASIEITAPPSRRTEAPIKLSFGVDSLDEARRIARERGGQLNDPSTIWAFDGQCICDGVDPEGNVVQFRAPAG